MEPVVPASDVPASCVLVIGEALVDVVKRPDGAPIEYAGGSAANVAVALARLERRVQFHTAFADDRYGEILRRHLEGSGVVLAGDPASIEHTSSAVATLAEDGSASYVFDIDWRLGTLELGGAEPVAVHTSSMAVVLRPGCEDVVAALSELRGVAVISYDVNVRPSVTGTGPEVIAAVERVVALADVVKASDEDLESLYPERTLTDSADALLALGPVAVVVTRGGDGATWVTERSSGHIPSPPVVVADTIGAGDTFGAGLIDALCARSLVGPGGRDALKALEEADWRALCEYAARVAAVTVSRPGADPPYKHEL
jgi:fructokinase